MKKMYRSLWILLVASMLAGCGASRQEKGTVYFLNMYEATDDAWQDIGEEYTRQTGGEVKIITAHPDNYSLVLDDELGKTTRPSVFILRSRAELDRYEDYCMGLSFTDFAGELTTNEYNLYDDDGELYAVGFCPDREELLYLAVNEECRDVDRRATLDFLYWVVTSKEGTAMLAEQYGHVPFENATTPTGKVTE